MIVLRLNFIEVFLCIRQLTNHLSVREASCCSPDNPLVSLVRKQSSNGSHPTK